MRKNYAPLGGGQGEKGGKVHAPLGCSEGHAQALYRRKVPEPGQFGPQTLIDPPPQPQH